MRRFLPHFDFPLQALGQVHSLCEYHISSLQALRAFANVQSKQLLPHLLDVRLLQAHVRCELRQNCCDVAPCCRSTATSAPPGWCNESSTLARRRHRSALCMRCRRLWEGYRAAATARRVCGLGRRCCSKRHKHVASLRSAACLPLVLLGEKKAWAPAAQAIISRLEWTPAKIAGRPVTGPLFFVPPSGQQALAMC